jgi:type II secretory ATPase GspE/PulE/Tfp pilus assembly ATPase PilB-like protein
MSDLSQPPQTLIPPAAEAPNAPPAQPAPKPFAWPTPPSPTFGAPQPQTGPEPAEIEGPNGKVWRCRLIGFDADDGTITIHGHSARGPLSLRPSQFKRLTLLRPLLPLPAQSAGSDLPALPATAATLRYRDGSVTQVTTIGHVDVSVGLFTFAPVGDAGAVLRSFYPRAWLAEVALGRRIGELLVEQSSASPEQVEAAAAEQQRLRARKVGEILMGQEIVTAEQLLEAIEQQARMPMVRVGEALIALGFINQAQLDEALRRQKLDRGVPLGELLVRNGAITRTDLQTALARKMGYPVVDLRQFTVETEALRKLPLTVARRIPALPLLLRGGRLVVALEDPTARELIDELEFSTQCRVLPVLVRGSVLTDVIERAYGRIGQATAQSSYDWDFPDSKVPESESAERLLASLESREANETRREEPQIEQSDNSLVRLINTMIIEARQQGVSDIHIECPIGNEKVRVRFRRDGTLRPYLELPPAYRQAIIARIKIMCDLDISERRKPQDGKIAFGRFVQGQNLELRVATIPTADNVEDAVLRLLEPARALPLDKMDIASDTLDTLKAAIQRPHGIVLCVGPTGSGKTTTLHAALAHVNTPDRKIWTAEDPVEITQPGLRQIQVNPKIGWTFAKALRALLRADPDIVMIGEIRDSETAEIAIEASLTGHLVLSTLHTNSAAETVVRLLDMDMDPFSFADALVAVLSQRLVRRLCPQCAVTAPAEAGRVEALVTEYLACIPEGLPRPSPSRLLAEWRARQGAEGNLQLRHAPGCKACDNTGLAGRVGLHELLVVDGQLRRMIQTKAPAVEILRAAIAQGMRSLRQDGILKVVAGLTTIDEVRAAAGS